MYKKLIMNKKAQNTAEYAILIALVIAGIIAMQTYAQRALQGTVRDGARYMTNETSNIGSTYQYEPYYLNSDYDSTRQDWDQKILDGAATEQSFTSDKDRSGSQNMLYDTSVVDVPVGL